ncbi:MAG: DUF2933 domain-containing protein [Acidimicrobiales bacterium]
MCLNRKVLLGVGVVALGVLLFARDSLGSALPLLLVAACPLSMVLMMGGMSRAQGRQCGTGGARPSAITRGPVDQDEVAALRAELAKLRALVTERAPRPEPEMRSGHGAAW